MERLAPQLVLWCSAFVVAVLTTLVALTKLLQY